MNTKKSLSIEAATDQLKQAIAANQGEIVSELATIREKLQNIVDLVGASSLGTEVKSEIKKLSSLFELPNSYSKSHTITRQQVKTKDKKNLIDSQLKKNGGEIAKAELLEIAGSTFGIEPAATFLDTALKDKRYGKRTEGNRAFVYLIN